MDASEVDRLAVDLGRVPGRAVPKVTAAVTKGAVNIKNDWADRWKGLSHAPALASAVTYDMEFGVGWVGAVIGPDKEKRQGALGNIIEYGTVNNAPRPGGGPALAAEEPKFTKALSDIAGRALD